MAGKQLLLCATLVCMLICCLAENTGRNPPKIVTKGGNLVIQAGEDGNIVFEPGQGKQVLIGGNVLNASGAAGAKGEKGDQGIQGPPGKNGDNGKPGQNGTKGEKGEAGPPGQTVSVNGTVNATGLRGPKGEPGPTGHKGVQGFKGSTGQKGEPGTQGPAGKNGTAGIQGPPGENGSKGEPGPQGPPGPLFNTMNQSALSCRNSSDYGSVRFMSGFLQVCTELGWKKLTYQDSLCQWNIPRMNHEAFLAATFGILLQFNGNLHVNLSPNMNFTNMTTVYNQTGGRNTTQYVQGIMGQAVQLQGQEYINLHGIPGGFWSGDEWSVMGLFRFHDGGILDQFKYVPVLGDGDPANNKGFHLGLRKQQVLYGFYTNDVQGTTKLDYNKWYHLTWTWQKSNNMRKIYVDGKVKKEDNTTNSYQGISGKTQIGTWWSSAKTNVEVDTLYITNKIIDYMFEQQMCFAKVLNYHMP